MVDRLDIENRICCYYCKFLALYVQSHYTKNLNSGGIERSNSCFYWVLRLYPRSLC